MCTVEQCATYQSARSVALQKEFAAPRRREYLAKMGGTEKCHTRSSHRASDAEEDPAVKATTAPKSDEDIYESLVAQGKRSGKAIGRQVEEQPVVSLLLAFAVGFCVSRLLSR
jgi:hypothetical protein